MAAPETAYPPAAFVGGAVEVDVELGAPALGGWTGGAVLDDGAELHPAATSSRASRPKRAAQVLLKPLRLREPSLPPEDGNGAAVRHQSL